MKIPVTFILLFFTGLLGSFLSKQISLDKISIWWILITSTTSGLIWAYMAKSLERLIYTAVLFDIIYAIAFMLGFLLMGEPLSIKQLIGFLLALGGLSLMQ